MSRYRCGAEKITCSKCGYRMPLLPFYSIIILLKESGLKESDIEEIFYRYQLIKMILLKIIHCYFLSH